MQKQRKFEYRFHKKDSNEISLNDDERPVTNESQSQATRAATRVLETEILKDEDSQKNLSFGSIFTAFHRPIPNRNTDADNETNGAKVVPKRLVQSHAEGVKDPSRDIGIGENSSSSSSDSDASDHLENDNARNQ